MNKVEKEIRKAIINNLKRGKRYSCFNKKIYRHDENNFTKTMSRSYQNIIDKMIKENKLKKNGNWYVL